MHKRWLFKRANEPFIDVYEFLHLNEKGAGAFLRCSKRRKLTFFCQFVAQTWPDFFVKSATVLILTKESTRSENRLSV